MSDDEYEALAAEFHRDTGYMAPGKDDARGYHDPVVRGAMWEAWGKLRNRLTRAEAARDDALLAARKATLDTLAAHDQCDALAAKLVEAERERDANAQSGLESVSRLVTERDALRAALVELVACKDLKDRFDVSSGPVELIAMREEYERRKPIAWDAARTAIAHGGAKGDA